MAISAGNTISWSDIQALYTKVNNTRSAWNLSKVSVPGNPGAATPSNVQNLKTAMDALLNRTANNKKVTGVYNLTVPSQGSYIKPFGVGDVVTSTECVFTPCSHNGFGSNTFDTFHSQQSGNGSQYTANSFST